MKDLIAEFVNHRIWAIVGVSTNPVKYGNRIFRDLQKAGYTVYPVNPKGGDIGGHKIYTSLRDLPEKPEVVDIVVPPNITEQVVRECYELGLNRVWMQPGAESLEAVRFCSENGIGVVYNACAMVHKKRWK